MKKYTSLYLSLAILVLFFSCKSSSQVDSLKESESPKETKEATPPDFDPYFDESQGISSLYGPQSIVRNVLQDSKGNIWLASFQGLVHYDGETFTNITNKEGLRRHRFFSMLEDRTGNIWFGTIGAGIYLYDGKTFTNITTKEGLVNDNIGTLYEDKAGNIWIGTTAGISIYDGKTFENYTEILGLPNGDINAIVEDETGKFWIGSRGEAFFYDPSTSMMSLVKTFSKIKKEDESTFTNVRCIIKDSQGNMWLGGNDGLWRYDGESFSNYTTNFGGYIYEDSKGNIWTSTAANPNGNTQDWLLSRYDKKAQASSQISPDHIKSENNMFFGIREDADGGIWFGTLRGAYRYDGKGFDYFREAEGEE